MAVGCRPEERFNYVKSEMVVAEQTDKDLRNAASLQVSQTQRLCERSLIKVSLYKSCCLGESLPDAVKRLLIQSLGAIKML